MRTGALVKKTEEMEDGDRKLLSYILPVIRNGCLSIRQKGAGERPLQ